MDICNVKEERICNYCKKKGHIIKDCKKLKWKNNQHTRHVDIQDDQEGDCMTAENKISEYYSNHVNINDKSELKLKVKIGNNEILALLDTGSTVNLINSRYISRMVKVKGVNLKSANDTSMKVLGKTVLDFKYRDLTFQDEFVVTDDIRLPMILGFPFCKKEKLVLEFKDDVRISLAKERLRDAGFGEHKIVTTCATPVAAHCYRRSAQESKEIEKIVNQHLKEGIIRESNSPWRSPTILKEKKTGDFRLCIDYRRLNQVTIKDKYPMPRIDETLEQLSGSCVFSKLDALSGFLQIRMHEDDIEKTAFECRAGLFEFWKMPFGLANGSATFQRVMNRILRPYLNKFAVVYIDDIIIYSKNEEDHKLHLKEVFRCLEANGLVLNKKKCEYMKKEIHLLGHLVNKDGISISEDRLEAIETLDIPISKKSLASFLGLINYCCKFIQNITQDTRFLYGLLKKDSKFNWDTCLDDLKYTSAINKLKEKIKSADVLALPSEEGQFILTTDASNIGIGAILSQMQDKKERIISYFSRPHSKAENNYSTTEKELLAVIKSVEHFRPYLISRKFLLFTDHSAITFLFTSRNMKARLARWSLILQEYDMDIVHIKGELNPSDCLSRLVLIENNLRDKEEDFRKRVRSTHVSLAHASINTLMYEFGKERIKNKKSIIEAVVKECIICQRAGFGYVKKSMIAVKSKFKNELWEIDLVGPLPTSSTGYKYLLTIVDHYSKFADVHPLRSKDSFEVTETILRTIQKMGIPKIILSDNGTEFKNEKFRRVCAKNNIELRNGAPYTPTTTGGVERFNRTFMDKLRKVTDFGCSSWVDGIRPALRGYLNSFHRGIGCTPIECWNE
ncbi:Retrovirus-related Pol polyprotein from transposon, partial [Nosema granulosis]